MGSGADTEHYLTRIWFSDFGSAAGGTSGYIAYWVVGIQRVVCDAWQNSVDSLVALRTKIWDSLVAFLWFCMIFLWLFVMVVVALSMGDSVLSLKGMYAKFLRKVLNEFQIGAAINLLEPTSQLKESDCCATWFLFLSFFGQENKKTS